MNNKAITFGALMVAMTLSACGGGSPDGGGAPSIPVSPIDGMNANAAAQVGITEGDNVEFDFVNQRDRVDGRTGGRIAFFNGEERGDGTPDGAQHVRIIYDIDDLGTPETREYTTTYNEGIYDTNTEEVRVSTVSVNGQNMQRASIMQLDGFSETAIGTESFVYIPAEENDAYVGMVGVMDSSTLDTGIFGRRTTRSEVSSQRGTAQYRGVAEAAVVNGPNGVEGIYSGEATATIDFDNAGSPSIVSGATLNPELGGSEAVTYGMAGNVNANGSLNITSTTLQGQATSYSDVQGALYGPNGESLGYVYDMAGPGATPLSISGGAILNQD